MKFNFLRITLIILSAVFSASLFAATSQVPNNRTIKSLRTFPGYVIVEYTPLLANALCVSSSNNRYAVIDWRTNEQNKSMYAAALSAFLLGKTVGMGLSDAPCNSFGGGVPSIYRLDVY